MSDPTPEQRKLVNKYVIVFDFTRSTITTEKVEKYKGRVLTLDRAKSCD